MKKRLLSLITSPYFITAILTLLIWLLTPDYFSKYKVTLVEQNITGRPDVKVVFQDLNGDGKSEMFHFQKNTAGKASFMLHHYNGDLIDQFNFPSLPIFSHYPFGFLDADKDGFKEIYLVTRRNDSALLNIIEPMDTDGIYEVDIFIDSIIPYQNEYNLWNGYFKLYPMSDKARDIVLFDLNSGYNGYPRKIYSYDNGEIKSSPHLTNSSSIQLLSDINADGFDEIICRVSAYGNSIDSIYTKRSDYSSWLNVLDKNLNFLFDPVEFDVDLSSNDITVIEHNNTPEMVVLLNSPSKLASPSKLMRFSNSGQLLQEKPINTAGRLNNLINYPTGEKLGVYNSVSGKLHYFDYNLMILDSIELPKTANLFSYDLNGDSSPEWVSIASDYSSATIYDTELKFPVTFDIPRLDIRENLRHGVKEVGNHVKQLFLQKHNWYYIFSYTRNNLYMLKYLSLLLYFGILFLLVSLISKAQQIRLARKKELEDQIATLQLKAIKNQVDPHFVFNALNTISAMTLMDNKLEVDDFITKFSDLMRQTLSSSDKITHELKEELTYVENYVHLQQLRFNKSFNYKVELSKNVNSKTLVPKHIIYSYIENAIKHGLSRLDSNGKLVLTIKNFTKGLQISIENNGGGLERPDKPRPYSTGRGIEIMEEIYALYKKLYKKNIEHIFTTLYDKEGSPCGVKVQITILNK